MKVFIGIVLILASITILISGLAFVWTFNVLYLRIWMTAIALGFFMLKAWDETEKPY